MKKNILLIIVLLVPIISFATHNRAGEITYKQKSDLTYEITVVTYTAFGPNVADRPELEVRWGDGTYTMVPRIKEEYLNTSYKRNTYIWTHTYPGPGAYEIVVEDPNRNVGVNNIPNSVNVKFTIKTLLLIDPGLGYNNTPVLLNYPVDRAALGHTFIHNPAAFDPDGDSLSYKLAICLGEGGEEIEGYTFPPFTDSLVVNEVSGDLVWEAPSRLGVYNVAMLIEEWRNGVKIGKIIRDMQIEVYETDNNPPFIDSLDKVCIEAGKELLLEITAEDLEDKALNLSASGGPLTMDDHPATLEITDSMDYRIQGKFSWETQCSHVRKQPYLVVFKVQDNNPDLNLVDFMNLYISVIGPAPENVQVSSQYKSLQIDWEASTCEQVNGYKIYRSNAPVDYEPDVCGTGIPDSLNYELVGSTTGWDATSFVDNNQGVGLNAGTMYCYRIVAYYSDGAESYPSEEACGRPVGGKPYITNVSVLSTDSKNGEIFVAWEKPKEEDLENSTGPYTYKLYRSDDMNGMDFRLIDSLNQLEDTSYQDKGLNTLEKQYAYKVELYNSNPGNTYLIGNPQNASSNFITSRASHREIILEFNENVPWQNDEYVIYRKGEYENSYDSLGISREKSFIDQSLDDENLYCYKVKALGHVVHEDYSLPVENMSQIACDTPSDTVAPCPPILNVESVCDSLLNHLRWNNVNDSCAKDAAGYRVYFSPFADHELEKIDSLKPANEIEYRHYPEHSMAGCYAVTAYDSLGNESVFSNIVCVDHCVNYELPNVFTPNGDGHNDFLKPYPYNIVEKIELKIFDRSGSLVFETEDPEINWDGKHYKTRKQLAAGVYYYICNVYEQRLTGIEPRYLVGFVHILYGQDD